MGHEPSSRVGVLLLETLRQLETEPHTLRDNSAIGGLERYVLRLVGQLDTLRRERDRSSATAPIPASVLSKILEILHNTLAQIEQVSDAHPDLAKVKWNLVREIARLEAARNSETALATETAVAAPAQSPPAGLEAPTPDTALPLLFDESLSGSKEKLQFTHGKPAPDRFAPPENDPNSS